MIVLILSLFMSLSAHGAKNEIVVLMNTEVATMNPFQARAGWDYPWYEPVFMRLVHYDPETGDYVPGIATSWRLLDNQKDFLVKIRQDLKFSNGDPVTAEDIQFSFEQYKS